INLQPKRVGLIVYSELVCYTFSLVFPVTITFAPCSEKRFAIALPFPLVEPVITATLSSSNFISSPLLPPVIN
ncbi:MAG: hypothetical protein WBE34_18590, partial [Candidatus Nitrosopolaris sp.]